MLGGKFYLLLIYILLVSNTSSQKVVPKITVYFESLCPYSIEFITTSIKEFYSKVTKPNVAYVELIPYGNANESYDPTTKKYTFSCQHGDNECYGNLVSTCSLNMLGRVKGQLNIICLLENIYLNDRNFDKTLEYCMSSEPELLKEVQDCIKSDMGNIYQHQMAQKTGDHLGVPWILVDGVYDEEDNEIIYDSLFEYLCGEDKSKCLWNIK